jgi:hypothetical protein
MLMRRSTVLATIVVLMVSGSLDAEERKLDHVWSDRLEYVGIAVVEPGYHVWGSSPVIGPMYQPKKAQDHASCAISELPYLRCFTPPVLIQHPFRPSGKFFRRHQFGDQPNCLSRHHFEHIRRFEVWPLRRFVRCGRS